MKQYHFLQIVHLCWLMLVFSASCETPMSPEGERSEKAELLTLTLTIAEKNYNANVNNQQATVTLDEGVAIPSSATIDALTISDQASARPALNASINLTDGVGSIVITAEDNATKKTYNINVLAGNAPPPNGTPKRQFAVGFYNCENLFDTEDDAGKDDKEFLPTSAKMYTNDIYQRKLRNIAEALLKMEEENPKDSLAWIGLAEVENLAVLEDLVNHNNIKKYGWKIIHVESSDPRGIDVALLYNPLLFKPTNTSTVIGVDNSREIVLVSGELLGKSANIFLNHWTSRIRGSEDKRIRFASAVKNQVTQLFERNPSDYIFIAGDFNDNPDDISILQTLEAQPVSPLREGSYLINGFNDLFQQNTGGTSYYDGGWDIFDQIILSSNMHPSNATNTWRANKHAIFSPTFMQTGTSPQRYAPRRFWDGDELEGGYSDHFPVYIEIGIY